MSPTRLQLVLYHNNGKLTGAGLELSKDGPFTFYHEPNEYIEQINILKGLLVRCRATLYNPLVSDDEQCVLYKVLVEQAEKDITNV